MDSAFGTASRDDLDETLQRRRNLAKNENLQLWYESLYSALQPSFRTPVLEVGSGTSPLKRFDPRVITSDVLAADYLDLVFDAHSIDQVREIPDASLGTITMTNVLHHLADPLRFLSNAAVKLRPNGKLIIVEPYISPVSFPVLRYIHPEPTILGIQCPELDTSQGPLYSANQAMPYLLFFKRSDWLSQLDHLYKTGEIEINFHSSLSYFLTGGITRRSPIPQFTYRFLLRLDLWLTRKFPRSTAAFFIATMERR